MPSRASGQAFSVSDSARGGPVLRQKDFGRV